MPANQPPTNHPALARLRELGKILDVDPLLGFVRSPLEPYNDTLRTVAEAIDEATAEWDLAVTGVAEATASGAALARSLDTDTDPDTLALTLAKLEDITRRAEAEAILARKALQAAKAATSSYRAAAKDAVRNDSTARDQYVAETLHRLGGLHTAYREAVTTVQDLTTQIRGVVAALADMAEASGDAALGSRVRSLNDTLPGRLDLARLGRGADATSPAVVGGVLSDGLEYLKAHGTVVGSDHKTTVAMGGAVPVGEYAKR